jgi:uncharacterized protein YlxP (DUF503 family)
MNKCTKTYKVYNIVSRLRKKYGVTAQYLYQSVRGERNSDTSLSISEDYKKTEREINKILQKI